MYFCVVTFAERCWIIVGLWLDWCRCWADSFGGWTGADVHLLVLAQLIRPECHGPLKPFLLEDAIAKNSSVSIMTPGSLAPVWHASLLALALLIRP